MDDTISRRAAIKAFEKRFVSKNGNIIALTFEGCKKVIESLPPADVPERKKGKWNVLYYDDCPQDGIWKCSVCGHIRLAYDDITPTNFCPNCGAEMRQDDPSHPFADDVMMKGEDNETD